MKALVLAAGKSERLRGVLHGLPKPMARVLGKPLLEYNVENLRKYGITDIWINLHYQPEAIRAYFKNGATWDVSLRYSYEEKILGTAGAVRKLADEWTSPFFVVYGDNITNINLQEMETQHRKTGAAVTMAVFDPAVNPNTGMVGGKVLLTEKNEIVGFTESQSGNNRWVNAGVYVLNPEAASLIPENCFCDFGRDLFPQWINRLPLKAYPITGYCLGPDTPEALSRVEEILQKETAR